METISEKEAIALFEDSPCTEEKRIKIEEIFKTVFPNAIATIDSNHSGFGEISIRVNPETRNIDLYFMPISEFIVMIDPPVSLFNKDITLIKECLDYLNSES